MGSVQGRRDSDTVIRDTSKCRENGCFLGSEALTEIQTGNMFGQMKILYLLTTLFMEEHLLPFDNMNVRGNSDT